MHTIMDPSAPWNLETLRGNETWLRPLVRALVDDATADDVLQDTWLQAWRRPPRTAGTLRNWLASVAINFARSRRRDERRRRRHECTAAAAPVRGDVESTAATVERLALHRAISAAVLELPESFRTVVLLRHYHGLDAAAIASRTGTTPANVRQRLHRGHQWLRERIDTENGPQWRRSSAVLALLAQAAPPPPRTTSAALTPALLAMNNFRLAITTLVVGSLIGGALLAPQWFATPESAPPHVGPSTIASAATPRQSDPDAGIEPPDQRVAVDHAPTAGASSGALAGSVVDTTGRPVGGVRIGLRPAPDRPEADLAITDSDGVFAFAGPWPPSGVDALDRWVALAVRPPQDAPKLPALLVVVPCRSQMLRVIDHRGAPLSGARIEVANRALVDFPEVLEHAQEQRFPDATTDADGRAAWPCLPLQATTFAISCSGFTPQFLAIDASTPADLLVTMHPQRAGARLISGVVTDARGAWVAGASVGLGNRRTTADAYGHFVLTLAPGEEVRDDEPLHAHAPSWYPAIIRGFGARVNAASERAQQQDLELRQRVLEIAGQVLDDRGEPCAGLLVYPWQLDLLTDQESAEDLAMPADAAKLSLAGNPIRAFTRTDDAGRFLLSGLGATDYRLRVHDDRAMWGYTTSPIAGGSSGVTIRLPTAPLGPVAGRVTTREGTPAAGVRLRGYVEVLANGGGMVGSGVSVSATTDAEGRFRVERMPRLGVQLGFTGDEWIDHSVALAEQPDPEALQVTVLRRCHVRVECTGAAWADARVEFQDGQGVPLLITERRRSTVMSRDGVELHRGKTGVFAISEAAATMVLRTRDGKREQRVPVVPRPGEVTAFVHHVD